MKKNTFRLLNILIMIVMIFIGGCSRPAQQPQKQGQEDRLTVYTSFYPMYDFAKRIGKDKINVQLMIPPGVEVHDWEPTAKLMGEMEKADVFIYNGLDMEPWAEKLINTLQSEELIVVKATEGVTLLAFEEHEEEEEDGHGDYDPHVWLNPINAMKQAENIKDAFVKADGKNKDFYEANYQGFAEELQALDQKYMQELSNLKRNEMIVAHGAFGYLTEKYGLKQVAISGLSPQEEPSAAKMAEISNFAKSHDLRYIFFESLTSPRLAEVLAQEAGAQTEVLNPLEGLTLEEINAGKDYISVMEENLAALKKALGE